MRTEPITAWESRTYSLEDAIAETGAIHSHLERGDLSDGLAFDAVRVRLIEIGEAVKALPAQLLATEPALPWAQLAGMRDRLAHRYFDTSHAILAATSPSSTPPCGTSSKSKGWATTPDRSGPMGHVRVTTGRESGPTTE